MEERGSGMTACYQSQNPSNMAHIRLVDSSEPSAIAGAEGEVVSTGRDLFSKFELMNGTHLRWMMNVDTILCEILTGAGMRKLPA